MLIAVALSVFFVAGVCQAQQPATNNQRGAGRSAVSSQSHASLVGTWVGASLRCSNGNTASLTLHIRQDSPTSSSGRGEGTFRDCGGIQRDIRTSVSFDNNSIVFPHNQGRIEVQHGIGRFSMYFPHGNIQGQMQRSPP